MNALDRWIDDRAGRAELWLRTCSTRDRIACDVIGAAVIAFVVGLILGTATGRIR